MNTPESILEFEPDYVPHSWEDYTPAELGSWIHLLLKRSEHRVLRAKKDKDIMDAQNYLDMLQEHINHAARMD